MRRFWPRFGISRLMFFIVLVAIVFASLRFASGDWAGIALLLTASGLCWAVLSVIYRRGASRAFWLGFALFGATYMGLTAETWWFTDARQSEWPTNRALEGVMPYLDASNPALLCAFPGPNNLGPRRARNFFAELLRDPDSPNRRLCAVLDRPIPVAFSKETPFEEVIQFVKRSTTSWEYPRGIPIYIDPIGLQEADKTMMSPVVIEVDETIPLSISLKLILKQLDLMYDVRDGMLSITARSSNNLIFEPEAFQRIGHCWFAWVAGLIGGGVGIYVRASSLARRAREESAGV